MPTPAHRPLLMRRTRWALSNPPVADLLWNAKRSQDYFRKDS